MVVTIIVIIIVRITLMLPKLQVSSLASLQALLSEGEGDQGQGLSR